MKTWLKAVIFSVCCSSAGAGVADPLTEYLNTCPSVQAGNTLNEESEERSLAYRLEAWSEWVPRLSAGYAQRQLVRGPAENLTLGVIGSVPNPFRFVSLWRKGYWFGEEEKASSRSLLSKERAALAEKYFEWLGVRDLIEKFSASAPLWSTYDKELKMELDPRMDWILDGADLSVRLENLKVREALLKQTFEGCTGKPPEPSSIKFPTPTEIRSAATRWMQNNSLRKQCEADLETRRAKRSISRLQWLPDIAYSYQKALPTGSNTFQFSEWFVGLQITLPLDALASPYPTLSECALRNLEEERRIREKIELAIQFGPLLEKMAEKQGFLAERLENLLRSARQRVLLPTAYFPKLRAYESFINNLTRIQGATAGVSQWIK